MMWLREKPLNAACRGRIRLRFGALLQAERFSCGEGTPHMRHCAVGKATQWATRQNKNGGREDPRFEYVFGGFALSKKLRSFRLRLVCFSFRSALASISRIGSRVTENCWPTSSSV